MHMCVSTSEEIPLCAEIESWDPAATGLAGLEPQFPLKSTMTTASGQPLSQGFPVYNQEIGEPGLPGLKGALSSQRTQWTYGNWQHLQDAQRREWYS